MIRPGQGGAAMLEAQQRRFEEKFGRPPGPEDPLFFGPNADQPQPVSPAGFGDCDGRHAGSFGGTSTTRSPSARSRFAMCLPMPWHPSTAHIRTGHALPAASIARYPAASVPYRPPPRTVSSLAITSIVAERLCGSIPITARLIQASSCSGCAFPELGGHRARTSGSPPVSRNRRVISGGEMPALPAGSSLPPGRPHRPTAASGKQVDMARP